MSITRRRRRCCGGRGRSGVSRWSSMDRGQPSTPAATGSARDDPVDLHVVAEGETFDAHDHEVRALAAAHGDAVTGDCLLWDVTGPDGARLLYATDTGPLCPETLGALAHVRPGAPGGDVRRPRRARRGPSRPHGPSLGPWPRSGPRGPCTRRRGWSPSTSAITTHPRRSSRSDSARGGRRSTRTARRCARAAAPQRPPRPGRILVLGGARSGKSSYAEALLTDRDRVTYVATAGARPDDEEWQARVQTASRAAPRLLGHPRDHRHRGRPPGGRSGRRRSRGLPHPVAHVGHRRRRRLGGARQGRRRAWRPPPPT